MPPGSRVVETLFRVLAGPLSPTTAPSRPKRTFAFLSAARVLRVIHLLLRITVPVVQGRPLPMGQPNRGSEGVGVDTRNSGPGGCGGCNAERRGSKASSARERRTSRGRPVCSSSDGWTGTSGAMSKSRGYGGECGGNGAAAGSGQDVSGTVPSVTTRCPVISAELGASCEFEVFPKQLNLRTPGTFEVVQQRGSRLRLRLHAAG